MGATMAKKNSSLKERPFISEELKYKRKSKARFNTEKMWCIQLD
jgi:hypothetical protein